MRQWKFEESLPVRSQKKGGPPAVPPEAAVTYTRLSDEAEPADPAGANRVEPHFTAAPPERKARFEEVAAPVSRTYAEDRASIDPEVIAALDAPPKKKKRRRSPVLRFVLLVGALAVLGGAGVLAATVVHVLYGGAPVAAEAPAAPAPVDLTDVPVPTPAAPLPDSGSAGPGVLALPPATATEAPLPEAATEAPLPPAPDAAATPVVPAPPAAAAAPAADAPLPRVRPAPTAEAALPPKAPVAQPAIAVPVAKAPAAAGDDDVNSLMSDVDRLLAEKKAQAAAAAAAQPLPADQAVNGVPPATAAATPDPYAAVQPLPPPAPATTTITPPYDPGVPIPPADIPNPGN